MELVENSSISGFGLENTFSLSCWVILAPSPITLMCVGFFCGFGFNSPFTGCGCEWVGVLRTDCTDLPLWICQSQEKNTRHHQTIHALTPATAGTSQ